MRTLTLNEKITLRGKLATRGALPRWTVRMDMAQAVFLWYRLFPGPISRYAIA